MRLHSSPQALKKDHWRVLVTMSAPLLKTAGKPARCAWDAPVDRVHRHGLRDAGQQRGHAALDGALRAVAQHAPDDNVADVLLGKAQAWSRPRTPLA